MAAAPSSATTTLTLGRSHDEDDYAALEAETTSPKPWFSRLRSGRHPAPPTSMDEADDNDDAASYRSLAEPTMEDQVIQECGIFFDGTQPSTGRPRRGFCRMPSEALRPGFYYRDARQVLSAPALSRYRSRYDQFNAEMIASERFDLELQQADVDVIRAQLPSAPATDSVATSSTLYRSRGRVFLKLPVDYIRLVVDPDLEVGRLSVEQWRDPQEADMEVEDESLRPRLRYILAIEDDLYRKMVEELSSSVVNRRCGLRRCCNEKEHVDIRVAVALMAVMLGVLLISTLIWPT